MLAQENSVAVTKNDQRWHTQLPKTLAAPPGRHDAIVQTLQRALRSIKGYVDHFRYAAKNGIGDIHQAAQRRAHNKAVWHPNQYQTAHISRVAQGILGSNRPAKRVCSQSERPLDIQPIKSYFQVINKPAHTIFGQCWIIATTMSPHVRRDNAHGLTKKAQLEEPL